MATRVDTSVLKANNGVAYSDVAYEYIRNRIMDMTLKPGQSLSEPELAKVLGISRTPVREALRRLALEGLVTMNPGQGATVYTLSIHDIEEIFLIKESIESMLVVEIAKSRTDSQVQNLDEAVSCMEQAVVDGDWEAWLEADVRYHSVLYEIANNSRAREIINNVNAQWHRLRVGLIALEERIQVSTREHREIAELIKAKDAEAAGEAMRRHLSNLRKTLIALIKHFVIPYVGENL